MQYIFFSWATIFRSGGHADAIFNSRFERAGPPDEVFLLFLVCSRIGCDEDLILLAHTQDETCRESLDQRSKRGEHRERERS